MRKSAHRRINITLPERTVEMIDQFAIKGERSRLIDDAVRSYILEHKKKDLSDRLKEGAIARAERNKQMAEEWFHLEEEVWESHGS
jgi:CopG family transcriptional regulator/antitoxin EndoAI